MSREGETAGALELPGRITETAYAVPRGLSLARYAALAATLGRLGRACPWLVGDLLLACERDHGEHMSQAAEATGLDPGTLVNLMWVCSRIEPPRRRGFPLTFAHHQEVAPLEPAEQDRWLDEAERGPWTRAALRRALRGGETGGDAPHPPHVCRTCGEHWPVDNSGGSGG